MKARFIAANQLPPDFPISRNVSQQEAALNKLFASFIWIKVFPRVIESSNKERKHTIVGTPDEEHDFHSFLLSEYD